MKPDAFDGAIRRPCVQCSSYREGPEFPRDIPFVCYCCRCHALERERDEARAELSRVTAERDACRDLVARLNSDGGQHQDTVGIAQAARDADARAVSMFNYIAALEFYAAESQSTACDCDLDRAFAGIEAARSEYRRKA